MPAYYYELTYCAYQTLEEGLFQAILRECQRTTKASPEQVAMWAEQVKRDVKKAAIRAA